MTHSDSYMWVWFFVTCDADAFVYTTMAYLYLRLVNFVSNYVWLRLILTCDYGLFNMRRCRCHVLLHDYGWFLNVTLTRRLWALIFMCVRCLFKLPTWLRLVDFKLWYSCLYEECLNYLCVYGVCFSHQDIARALLSSLSLFLTRSFSFSRALAHCLFLAQESALLTWSFQTWGLYLWWHYSSTRRRWCQSAGHEQSTRKTSANLLWSTPHAQLPWAFFPPHPQSKPVVCPQFLSESVHTWEIES